MQRPRPTGNKKERKPIGWVLRELDFNDGIRGRVGMDILVDIAEIMKDAYHIYTDVSFTGHRCHTAKDKCSRQKQAETTQRHAKRDGAWLHAPHRTSMDSSAEE